VLREILDHAQLEVRQRAHGERDPIAHEALDERRILVAAHAVIDALDLEEIQRLA
jgi:hypothetical protein